MDSTSHKWSTYGKWIGLSVGVAGLGISLLSIPFIVPGFRRYCLPFIPATNTQITAICNIARKHNTGKVIDLGSGDGRVVIALAQHGHYAVGCELNYLLVLWSRLQAILKGVSKNTKFIHSDLWKIDLGTYSTIVFFGVDEMMKPLGDKIQKEVGPRTIVISSRFQFPQWVPRDADNGVWEYHMTDNHMINQSHDNWSHDKWSHDQPSS